MQVVTDWDRMREIKLALGRFFKFMQSVSWLYLTLIYGGRLEGSGPRPG